MSVAQSVMLALGLAMTILAVVVPLGVLLGYYLDQRYSRRLRCTCADLLPESATPSPCALHGWTGTPTDLREREHEMTWHALIAKPEFERAVQAERRRQIEKGYDAAHDDEHGIEHLRRWRASYFRRGLVIAAAALDIAIEEHLARLASRCTCPTGDGSLRWPCPAHPPTQPSDR